MAVRDPNRARYQGSTKVSLGTAQVNAAKKRGEPVTTVNKGRDPVTISAPHAANKNAAALQAFGSSEAQALNQQYVNQAIAQAQAQAGIVQGQAPSSFASPTIAGVNNLASLPAQNTDPNLFGADSISAANNIPSPTLQALQQFSQGFINPSVQEGSLAQDIGSLAGVVGIAPRIKGAASAGTAFRRMFAQGANNIKKLPVVGAVPKALFNFNTKTRALLHNAVRKIPWKTGAALYLATQWIDAKAFAGFNTAESGDILSYPMRQAAEIGEQTGDWSLYDQLIDGIREVQQPENRTLIEKMLPWTESIEGTNRKIKNQQLAADVWERWGELQRTVSANVGVEGTTSNSFWVTYQEQKTQDEKELADLWIKNREDYLLAENLAKEENRAADARYWAAQREASYEQEKRMLELQRQYWEDIRAIQQSQYDDRAPSKLNFGLL